MGQVQRFIKSKTKRTVHLQQTLEFAAPTQSLQFSFANMHFQEGALITGCIMVVNVMPDADYTYYNDSLEVQGQLSFYTNGPLSFCLKNSNGTLVSQAQTIVLPNNVYVPLHLNFEKTETFSISGIASLKSIPTDGAFITIDVILNIEE